MTVAQILGGVAPAPMGSVGGTGIADREIRVNIAGIECRALHDTNGRTWVIVKQLCGALGIDPRGQQKRIQDPAEFDQKGVDRRSAPSDGGKQATLCLELKHCVYWLGGISKKSCKPEAQPKLRAVAAEIVSAIDVAINGPAKPARQLTPGETLALTAEGIQALEHQTAALSVALVGVQEEQAVQAKDIAALKAGEVETVSDFTIRAHLSCVGYKIAGTTDYQRSVRAMAGKALKKIAKADSVTMLAPLEDSRDGTHLLFPRAFLQEYGIPLVEEAIARKKALVLQRARAKKERAVAEVAKLEKQQSLPLVMAARETEENASEEHVGLL